MGSSEIGYEREIQAFWRQGREFLEFEISTDEIKEIWWWKGQKQWEWHGRLGRSYKSAGYSKREAAEESENYPFNLYLSVNNVPVAIKWSESGKIRLNLLNIAVNYMIIINN